MTASTLKIIAILGMLCNHIAHAFNTALPDTLYYILMMLGGLTFPIMAYLLTESYQYTSNIKKYGSRLLVFALISLVPFWVLFEQYTLNILFTLLLGLVTLYLYDHLVDRGSFGLFLMIAVLVSSGFDWGIVGIPMILGYYVIKNRYLKIIVPVSLMWALTTITIIAYLVDPQNVSQRALISECLFSFVGCGATIPLLLAYNGKRGRQMKYLFYVFYPVHLVLLAVIRYIY